MTVSGNRAAMWRNLAEACWLLAVVVVILFHDPFADRFDADRQLLLRAFALVALAAAGLAVLSGARRETGVRPVVVVILLLAVWSILATIFSVDPLVSLWGDLPRLGGTLSTLSSLVLVVIALPLLQDPSRRLRLEVALQLALAALCLYAVAQKMGLDPRTWSVIWKDQVMGTQGNPLFLGAILVLALPLTLAGAGRRWLAGRRPGAFLWALLLLLQGCTLVLTRGRGALLAAAFGLWLMGAIFAVRRWGRSGSVAAALVATLGLSVALWLLGPALKELRQGEVELGTREATIQQRVLVWTGVVHLLRDQGVRALVGYGPETLDRVFPPFVPRELPELQWEPDLYHDRAHNSILDQAVDTGIVGVALGLLAAGLILATALWRLGLAQTWVAGLALGGGSLGLGALTFVLSPAGSLVGPGLGLGLLAGAALLVLAAPWYGQARSTLPGVDQLWLKGCVAAVAGSLFESQVGFATAASHTLFWLVAALIVVSEPPPLSLSSRARGKDEKAAWSPTLFLVALIVACLSVWVFGLWVPAADEGGAAWAGWTAILGGGLVVACALALAVGLDARHVAGRLLPITLVWTGIYALAHGILLERQVSPDGLLAAFLIQMGCVLAVLTLTLGWPVPRFPWLQVLGATLALALALIAMEAVSWRWIRAAHALEAGRELQRAGDLPSSSRAFAAALELVPELDDHHLAQARARIRLAATERDEKSREGLFQDVEVKLLERLQARPLENGYLEELAYLHSRWGELTVTREAAEVHWSKATNAYRRALERDPWNARLRRSHGAVLLSRGHYRDAVEELSLAADLSPRSHASHLVLGRALFELERVAEARRAFERAVELDAETSWRILKGVARAHPESWRAHRDLAVLLSILGQVKEAGEAAEMALGAAEEEGATAFAQANSTLEGAF